MGYADELYNLHNVKCGYRRPIVVDEYGRKTGGELMAVYFKKGNFFGRIQKGDGRRIAMSSRDYKGPSEQDDLNKESIWGVTISVRLDTGCTLEKVNDHNREEFEMLLNNHPNLDRNFQEDYAAGLHGYANNKKHLHDSQFALYPYALMAKAAREYLEKTRPGWTRRKKDREKAKGEHNSLAQELYADSNIDMPVLTSFTKLPIPTPPESPMNASSPSPQFLAATGSPIVQPLAARPVNRGAVILGAANQAIINQAARRRLFLGGG